MGRKATTRPALLPFLRKSLIESNFEAISRQFRSHPEQPEEKGLILPGFEIKLDYGLLANVF